MLNLFKRRPKPEYDIKKIVKENEELKAKVIEFRVLLHWRGVACYRPFQLMKAYDEHFGIPKSKNHNGL